MLWTCQNRSFTSSPTPEQWAENLQKFIPYITVGGFTVIANLFVIASIAKHKNLRSRYILTTALAGGDLCQGMAFFTAGVMRLPSVADGTSELLVSTFDCMLRLYNVFFVLGAQLPILITCVISLERLIAVSFPLQFNKWPVHQYSIYTVIAIYVYCLFSLLLAYVAAANQHGRCVGNICYTEWAMGSAYGLYNYVIGVGFGTAAMLLYVAAIFAMAINARNLAAAGNSAALVQLRRQEKITKTMALIVLFTFIFVVLPSLGYMLGYILDTEFDIFDAIGAYIGVTFCSNSAINVILYALLNPELRGMFKRDSS